MISNLSIAGILFTLVVCFVPVVAIPVFFQVKLKIKNSLSIFILGMGGYAITQILIRTPLLNMAFNIKGFVDFATKYFILYALILSLSAALFETVGRAFVVKTGAKRGLDFNRSFLLGAGHGVIEAVTTVGMAFLNNIWFATMMNKGIFDSTLSAGGATVENIEFMKNTMLQTSPFLFFSSGIERFCAISIQITFTMIMVTYIKKKNIIKGSVICIICQTAASFISVLLGKYVGSIAAIIFMIVIAAGGIYYIMKLWKEKKIEPFKIG